MNTAEMVGTYRRAAELIRTGGLVQGTFQDGTAHCTVGALMAAKGVEIEGIELEDIDLQGAEMWWGINIVRSEIGHLGSLLGGLDEENLLAALSGFYTVTTWNDVGGRTVEDVVTLLEQAAEKLEADL